MNLNRYTQKLEELKVSGNFRELREIIQDSYWVYHENRKMLNLSSNDFLGLSSRNDLCNEFHNKEILEQHPAYSAVSSRLLSGNHSYYTLLENDLRLRYNKEAALVFNSGYHANIGILPALTGKQDLIIADKLVHASIIDGILLSKAEMLRYPHLDYAHLREVLSKNRSKYEQVFIVTESIFSMDGDVADLKELCALKKEFDTFLYVDEAHAVGIRGANALGCCEEQGCINDIDFIIGTFGKAWASYGAFVVCNELFRSYLVNTQRSLIFTTALPPINVAWTRFLLNQSSEFNSYRLKLEQIAQELRKTLNQCGYITKGESHIVPFLCGSNEHSVRFSNFFQENGFFVLPIRYPTVPKNEARIRFSLNAAIPDEEYERLFRFIKDQT